MRIRMLVLGLGLVSSLSSCALYLPSPGIALSAPPVHIIYTPRWFYPHHHHHHHWRRW